MAVHQLRAEPGTCHATFAPTRTPVLEIDSGDTVVLEAIPDVAWGIAPPKSTTEPRARLANHDPTGPCLVGPIAVRGARPGQALAVRLDEIVPGPWGFTWAGGKLALDPRLPAAIGASDLPLTLMRWTIDPEAHLARNQHGHVVPIAPFLGTIGTAHARRGGTPDPWRPRRTGGNLDCNLLEAGTTLLLPIEAEGARLSIGDTHAAQGDGEIAGTAIECMAEKVVLTCALATSTIDGPVALAPAGLVTFGFAEPLEDAVHAAIGTMLEVLGARLGLGRAEALALASAAVDVRITQLVNRSVGAHAVLSRDFLVANGLDLDAAFAAAFATA